MDNIEDILRALAEDPPDDNGSSPPDNSSGESGGGGTEGLFSGLDFNTIAKAATLMSAMGTQNDDERLLLALKPLLREENQAKVDTAIKLLKLVSLLPLLRESGLFGN